MDTAELRPWVAVLVYFRRERDIDGKLLARTSVAISTVVTTSEDAAISLLKEAMEVPKDMRLVNELAHPIELDKITEEMRRAVN